MALRDLFRRKQAEVPQQAEEQGMDIRAMLEQSQGSGSIRPGYQRFDRAQAELPGESAVLNGAEDEARQMGARLGTEAMLRMQGAEVRKGYVEEDLGIITKEHIHKAELDLMVYRSGKESVERRVIAAQEWWKLRNAEMQQIERGIKGPQAIQSSTLWLWCAIVNAHAVLESNMPEAMFQPREKNDEEEAKKLSDVVPVIMERNRFRRVYNKELWQLLTEGTLVSGTFWDKEKENGLGDVSHRKVNILNLFWEPGIDELEDSKQVFYTYLMDNDELLAEYPQLEGKVGPNAYMVAEYRYDDNVPNDNKSIVVDWYYKKRINGRTVLHLCTFCNGEILFSTENTGMAEGLYDDGRYPFDMLPLYPVEGSPAGYGLIDIGKDCQMDIDVMSRAMVLNGMVSAIPRNFVKDDGRVNEQEYADLTKMFVHVSGEIDENSIRRIDTPPMPAHVMNVYQGKIDELKYATGNTDVTNGNVPAGVTAASAIAALQEEQGKSKKDITDNIFEWFSLVSSKIISRIRQGYDVAREFMITGKSGNENEYISFDNSGLKPQAMQNGFGMEDMKRLPVFDIKVRVQRENAYTRLSRNELVLQMDDRGFFLPQNTDRAMMALKLMDFEGKEEMMNEIRQQGILMDAFIKLSQIALALAQQANPMIADQIAMLTQGVTGQAMQQATAAGGGRKALPDAETTDNPQEEAQRNPIVNRARERTENATRPN